MKYFIMLVVFFFFFMQAQAAWVVDPAGSYLGFASVKNDLIAENHSFTKVSGTVADSGDVLISVSLASVETLIPIRNERMQEMLFKVGQYPAATITSTIDVPVFTSLRVGEDKVVTIAVQVNLYGNDLSKQVLVKVTRSSESSFEVSSLGPIVIHASQFGLADGVEALRKVAGLQSIDLMVPVTFDLKLVSDPVAVNP